MNQLIYSSDFSAIKYHKMLSTFLPSFEMEEALGLSQQEWRCQTQPLIPFESTLNTQRSSWRQYCPPFWYPYQESPAFVGFSEVFVFHSSYLEDLLGCRQEWTELFPCSGVFPAPIFLQHFRMTSDSWRKSRRQKHRCQDMLKHADGHSLPEKITEYWLMTNYRSEGVSQN